MIIIQQLRHHFDCPMLFTSCYSLNCNTNIITFTQKTKDTVRNFFMEIRRKRTDSNRSTPQFHVPLSTTTIWLYAYTIENRKHNKKYTLKLENRFCTG